jgi:hypothetical protein
MKFDPAKRSTVYDNPVSHAHRSFESRKKTLSDRLAPLHERHSKEKAEMQNRHHAAGQKLAHETKRDSDYWSQFPSKPAGLDADAEKARRKLVKAHEAEREKLKSRHETEMAKAKEKAKAA